MKPTRGPAIHTYVDSVVKNRWEESYSDKIISHQHMVAIIRYTSMHNAH